MKAKIKIKDMPQADKVLSIIQKQTAKVIEKFPALADSFQKIVFKPHADNKNGEIVVEVGSGITDELLFTLVSITSSMIIGGIISLLVHGQHVNLEQGNIDQYGEFMDRSLSVSVPSTFSRMNIEFTQDKPPQEVPQTLT